MVYLGLLERARGVGTSIEAVALCRQRGIPVELDIIGSGRAAQEFEDRAAELGLLGDSVRFHGFLPYASALELVAKAEIGLIPHMAYESWNTTIPNKLFDYMAAGLAVVASDALPTVRVLKETGSGVWFRSGDAEDLGNRLGDLWKDGDLMQFGLRGRLAIEQKFNWERDGTVMVKTLEGLVEKRREAGAVDRSDTWEAA